MIYDSDEQKAPSVRELSARLTEGPSSRLRCKSVYTVRLQSLRHDCAMPPAYASGPSVALRHAGHQVLGAGDDSRFGAAPPQYQSIYRRSNTPMISKMAPKMPSLTSTFTRTLLKIAMSRLVWHNLTQNTSPATFYNTTKSPLPDAFLCRQGEVKLIIT